MPHIWFQASRVLHERLDAGHFLWINEESPLDTLPRTHQAGAGVTKCARRRFAGRMSMTADHRTACPGRRTFRVCSRNYCGALSAQPQDQWRRSRGINDALHRRRHVLAAMPHARSETSRSGARAGHAISASHGFRARFWGGKRCLAQVVNARGWPVREPLGRMHQFRKMLVEAV